MEIYVDTADINTVRRISEYFPLDGFTTNPQLLALQGNAGSDLLEQYRAYTEETQQKVFLQVTGETAEQMFAQAQKLRQYFGTRFIVKIPAVKEGYRAVKMCKAAEIPVTVTVIHSVMQALVAAKAGADYVAPYISHMDNLGGNGAGSAAEMVQIFKSSGYSCKVLGASFRTADQIKQLAIVGCQAVTIAPQLLETLILHPSTDKSMEGFARAWRDAYGEKQITT